MGNQMLFRKALIGLIVVLVLIFSGTSQAFAPISADLQQTPSTGGEQQSPDGNTKLVIDGISLDLTRLLNSEIPLFNTNGSGVLQNAVFQMNPVEKRINISINNSVIGLQFLNAAVDKTENSFALRFSGFAQAALVITAPEVDIVEDYVADVITFGEGMQRVCFLLDLENINGRVRLNNIRRVVFPGKTAEYTFIISADAPVTEWYVPPNLIRIPASVPAIHSKSEMKLSSEVIPNLEKMLLQARKDGVSGFVLTSTYRPYPYQKMLFANKVKQVGSEKEAAKIVARPGTSEHQSGLAIDFSANGSGLSERFASTPQGSWLGNNAWKYGFILRYPANKTSITKIIYEPWHFRYVGYPYSKIIHDRRLCLEEFVANLKKYGFYAVSDQNNSYVCIFNGSDGKIYLSDAVPKSIEVPNGTLPTL